MLATAGALALIHSVACLSVMALLYRSVQQSSGPASEQRNPAIPAA
jgi:hypothetical protein